MADIEFVNVSNVSAISLFPADYYTFYADAAIPANSSVFAVIDVSMPIDGLSAVLTVVSMQVVSILHSVAAFLFSAGMGKQARSQDCKFGGSFSVWAADIFRVLLYCYSLLAVSTVSVTEYTNIVVIK